MTELLDEAGLDRERARGEGPAQPRNEPAATNIPEKNAFEWFVMKTADSLSAGQLTMLLRTSLRGLRAALCLHRVCSGGTDPLRIAARRLDALIELLRSTRPRGSQRWLSVTFDDGYKDAVEYIASRSKRYPDVEWLCFACPRLCEQRVPFHWEPPGTPCEFATVEALRQLSRLPNVRLGNHTNAHALQASLTKAEAEREYVTSFADFDRLFGPATDFAFPFGFPEMSFNAMHVEALRRVSPGLIWSTERRPYRGEERRGGAVLPRLAIDSSWSVKRNALWIALLALKFRARGTPYRY
jgi:hypothetical protein